MAERRRGVYRRRLHAYDLTDSLALTGTDFATPAPSAQANRQPRYHVDPSLRRPAPHRQSRSPTLLPTNTVGCWTLLMKDSWGDGWNSAYWTWINTENDGVVSRALLMVHVAPLPSSLYLFPCLQSPPLTLCHQQYCFRELPRLFFVRQSLLSSPKPHDQHCSLRQER